MTRILFIGAFVLGALAILWIGRIFLGTDNLGLGVTVLIGLVYAIGTWELLQFRRATASLDVALGSLTQVIDDLYQWLLSLDSSLQNPVRLRIEGERNGLPAPVVTPYLVGLLVMLGLLGTFIGMVDTLRGAVTALQGTSELEAIRAGLAAPIEGLGLAFGTSVAGVAASAMLGLLSTISRRERLATSQLLDAKIGGVLRSFSGRYQQQLAFKAIQDQTHSLPAVAQQLGDLSIKLEQMGESMGQRVFASQQQFNSTISSLYEQLNDSVAESVQTSLVASTELISSNLQAVAEKTLAQVEQATLQTQQQLITLSEQHLSAANDAAQAHNALMCEAQGVSLTQQNNSTEELIKSVHDSIASATGELQSSSRALLASFTGASDQWAEQQQQQAALFNTSINAGLGQLRDDENTRGNAAIERLSELEAVVASHLNTLGLALEAPMTRLIEAASQTPKAAAQVIEKLRGEMTKNFARDNDLLSERKRLMEQLDGLSRTLENSSAGQRDAVDNLIKHSSESLAKVESQFAQRVDAESAKLAIIVDHFASSSSEMASLGDAFNAAVGLFSESNSQLIDNLARIETSLEQSTDRSDQQLAYYVAQAREIIDHNLLSHKEIVETMRVQQQQLFAVKSAV